MRWEQGVRIDGLDPNFLRWIKEYDLYVRRNYGFELQITSAFRDQQENEIVGGVKNSAHLKGLAIDVYAPYGKARYYIVKSAIEYGFRRIGVGVRHIHLDMDFSKPYPVIFPDIEK